MASLSSLAASPSRHPTRNSSSPRRRGSSIPEAVSWSREAAAYWIARSSRAMTAEFGAAVALPLSTHATRRPCESRDPVFQRRLRWSREAAAYWIARSSRAMTAEFGAAVALPLSTRTTRHPRESGDPVFQRRRRWSREAAAYWVARSSRAMTVEFDARSSSPSLPWRDDLDLVAGPDRGFGPAAFRQHVVIHRDREMAALVFEFAEQRVEAGGR